MATKTAELFRNRIIGYATKPADQFTANPLNYRKHPQRQRDAVNASLRELGWISTVIENVTTGNVIDGHERIWNALQRNEDVPYLQVELSEAEERLALAVFDPITNMAETDAQILDDLLREVNTGEAALQQLLAEMADTAGLYGDKGTEGDTPAEVDRAEELRQKWGVQPGQLWQLGEHRLVCGDCTDPATVARVTGGERAQAVVTSPPYPGADMWDDMGAVAEVERVGLDALRLCVEHLDDGCPILWNIANTPIGTQAGVVHTTTTTTTKHASEALGLLCYGEIIWSKPCQHLTPLSFMMRPVVPNLIHEYIMIFYKGKRKQRENSSGLSADDKAIRTKSVWDLATESATEVNHKAPFPLELARRCIALWSLEGDAIYEPFSGSGTTIIACENLGRKCRAVEISLAYVAVALERWHVHTGKTPVLIG